MGQGDTKKNIAAERILRLRKYRLGISVEINAVLLGLETKSYDGAIIYRWHLIVITLQLAVKVVSDIVCMTPYRASSMMSME